MKVTLTAGDHTPWQKDEILCLQVVSAEPDGAYTCETVETWPADLKERHAVEIANLHAGIKKLVDGHTADVEALQQQIGHLNAKAAEARAPRLTAPPP